MKILIPLALIITIMIHAAAPAPEPEAPHQIQPQPTLAQATLVLAKPLIGRVFTSTCTLDQGRYYRESLAFSAQGITRFSRRFFKDAQCQDPGSNASVREGHYALEQEEEGRLLLTVRHLQGQQANDSTPYFEALIHLDHDQLVLDLAPSPAQQYTAI